MFRLTTTDFDLSRYRYEYLIISITLRFQRNGSTMFDGHFNMDTGAQNINDFGILRKWNYKDTTRFFKSPCNVVEGSAGEFWSPYRQKDEIVMFSGDLCRSVAAPVKEKNRVVRAPAR